MQCFFCTGRTYTVVYTGRYVALVIGHFSPCRNDMSAQTDASRFGVAVTRLGVNNTKCHRFSSIGTMVWGRSPMLMSLVDGRSVLPETVGSLCSLFRLSTVGSGAFPVAAAQIWNSPPEHIVSAPTLQSFRRHVKTVLLPQSFCLWHFSGSCSNFGHLGHFKKLLIDLLIDRLIDRP